MAGTKNFPTLTHDGFTTAVAAYQRAVETAAEAQADLERLRGTQRHGRWPDGSPRYVDGELAAAVEADTDDRARASLEGRKDPGEVRTAKVRARITAAMDRVEVTRRAVTQATDAVRIVCRDEQAALLAAADDQATQARQVYADALEALVEARDAYFRARQVRYWLGRAGSGAAGDVPTFAPGMSPEVTAAVDGPNGTPRYVPALTVLRDEAVDPVQPRAVSHYDQRRELLLTPGGVVEGVTLRAVPVYADETPTPPPTHPGGLFLDGAPVFLGEPVSGGDDG